jgi:glycosyltransferase involved in cell wall biosynthesis
MGKVLFISNISKGVGSFSVASIAAAHRCGFEYHMAANWTAVSNERIKSDEKEFDIKIHNIDLTRSPFTKQNITAYKQMVKLIKQEQFDYIHCNTPVGGMLGRLAGKKCGVKKIIYQAHGFHFFNGAPLFNRTVLKWSEQIMAHWTDAIITMNEEDYQSAKKFRLKKGGKVYKGHGVGINLAEYQGITVDRASKRAELGLKDDDVVCISAGDLVARKNYGTAIEAIAKSGCSNLHYLICGVGPEKEKLETLGVEKGVNNRVHFLGYRTDMKELMAISDIFLFTTFQEGLPRSMMEAMASGLPCIASKIRGNVDLINDGENGYLCQSTDVDGFAVSLKKLYDDKSLRENMGKKNLDVIKEYDVEVVKKEIEEIYREVLK